ncbi:MAG TPA: hypothetical protein VJX72_14465 [Candidatus Acidoferrum sp.]|jgi:hypothetical protein|nr:hypothetical protein [Candidatus Acidoferrum sp.]
MKQLNKFLILGGAYLIVGGLLAAQAPPGPLTPPPPDPNAPVAPPPPKKPEVQPRKSILGYWKFNKDESDDGRAKLRQSREADNTNRGNSGGGYGGPRVGVGWPGSGGGYPHPQGGDISDSNSDLVNPPREIKLAQKFENDPEVVLSDDREHRTTFYTDGRKLEKDKDPDNRQVAARWDDKKLITDEKGAHGGKVSRSYELSSDGKQLIETVHLTDSKGNHPVNVQYVYDAAEETDRYSVH